MVISRSGLRAVTLLALEFSTLIRPRHHHTNLGRRQRQQQSLVALCRWDTGVSREPGRRALLFLPGSEPFLCFWTFRSIEPGCKWISSCLFIYIFIFTLKMNAISRSENHWREGGSEGDQWAWQPQEGYSISHLLVAAHFKKQMKIPTAVCSFEKWSKRRVSPVFLFFFRKNRSKCSMCFCWYWSMPR